MNLKIKCLLSIAVRCALAVYAVLPLSEVLAQIPGTESVESIFSLGSKLVGFDSSRRSLRFYTWQGSALREERSIPIEGSVSAVTSVPQGYAVATGMGRDALTAPMRIVVFTETEPSGRVVFERSGERNQINAIVWRDGKLWINFFTSKYMTAIGHLTPTKVGAWTFAETTSVRMGDSLDVLGDLAFVGRSYGDIQGQDGDLLMFKGGERTLLPSYRGVRSVRVVGDLANHRIFIGDGWHMNYGQLAQGRLSVISKRPEDSRYSLQILDYDPSTTDFRRLIPFRATGRDWLAALGSSSVVMYDQSGTAPKKTVYSQVSQSNLMDLAVVQLSAEHALVVVADRGLRVFEL